jgi:hypothetical protein
MLRKLMIGTLFMAALLALGGAFMFSTNSVAAQVTDTVTETQMLHRGGGRHGNGIRPNREAQAQVVADALGITVEELEAAKEAGTSLDELAAANGTTVEAVHAAVEAAHIANINDAVANGDITQEQADAMIERITLHQLAGQIFSKDDAKAAAAAALGITVEELDAAKEAGTLRDLVEESGVDVRAAVDAAREAAIDSALASGQITADQAAALREMPAGKGGHGGPGGRGGHGGREGGRGGNGRPQFETAADA